MSHFENVIITKNEETSQNEPAQNEQNEESMQKEESAQREESVQQFPRINNDRKTKNYRKGRFSEEEDRMLIEKYNMFIGDHKHNIFSVIEQYLNRNPKSLRERYCNHLDPNIDHSELSKEEKAKIKSIYETLKTPSFSEIARILNTYNLKGNRKRRTDLVVRNYLSPRLRKEKRIRDRMSLSVILNQ
ncbi:6565_t:CDS:2 [Diversispora eburnea]|uniref:6565_t:CDS:1 n=1 Tax=Diversispora eburnea TaxID=1213867 RepID=A0A9N9C5A4_9GLOM|nr:6565_t:CDS:2 [Diversispora eburnea]